MAAVLCWAFALTAKVAQLPVSITAGHARRTGRALWQNLWYVLQPQRAVGACLVCDMRRSSGWHRDSLTFKNVLYCMRGMVTLRSDHACNGAGAAVLYFMLCPIWWRPPCLSHNLKRNHGVKTPLAWFHATHSDCFDCCWVLAALVLVACVSAVCVVTAWQVMVGSPHAYQPMSLRLLMSRCNYHDKHASDFLGHSSTCDWCCQHCEVSRLSCAGHGDQLRCMCSLCIEIVITA